MANLKVGGIEFREVQKGLFEPVSSRKVFISDWYNDTNCENLLCLCKVDTEISMMDIHLVTTNGLDWFNDFIIRNEMALPDGFGIAMNGRNLRSKICNLNI